MRFGVEYQQNDMGGVGLIIFTAENLSEANEYVDAIVQEHGFTRVANLREIREGCPLQT